MKDALLVIDMQIGCFKTPRYNRDCIVDRINSVSRIFREKNRPVIFIQHNGIKENYLLPNTEDYKILDNLETSEKDFFVEKLVNDSFYHTNLEKILRDLNIETLYIAGLATDFCVSATVHSALVKDFNLVIVSDCHTTSDKPQIKAKDIIDYHNFLWANLTPTNGTVTLKKSHEIGDV